MPRTDRAPQVSRPTVSAPARSHSGAGGRLPGVCSQRFQRPGGSNGQSRWFHRSQRPRPPHRLRWPRRPSRAVPAPLVLLRPGSVPTGECQRGVSGLETGVDSRTS